MKKRDSSKVLVVISGVIAVVTLIAFVYYYFIKPFTKEDEKKEVLAEEKFELETLTMAYLNQNVGLAINDNLFNDAISEQYKVAAEYYYLKNGKDHLDEYDKILEVAKVIFDSKKVNFSNFTINIDSARCGKEKYSTLEGIIYNSNCDTNAIIYEIISTYSYGNDYVVEFYAANAIQKQVEAIESCDNFEIPFSYNLQLVDLEKKVFYDENQSKCCISECALEGIEPLKKEILNQIKVEKRIYKITFKKVNENFVFSKIKSV